MSMGYIPPKKTKLDIWAVGLAQWTPKGQMVKGSG